MVSLNVPVPGNVSAFAWEVRGRLLAFDRIRDEHTLVVKRFEVERTAGFVDIEPRVRETLAGTPPFAARLAGIDTFADPPAGSAPVVYLAVESPGLHRLHHDLVDTFGAVEGIEGASYTPHITLARGGEQGVVDALETIDVPEITWTVDRLEFWDPARRVPFGTVHLPA